jgi:histidine triad (HIT) family protein
MSDCLFCRIAAGEIPAEVVLRQDGIIAFRDITPQAPVHVLVIPVAHHADAGELAAADPQLAGRLLRAAAEVASAEGLTGGHRIVLNTGADAGQSVFHVHAHVLGGRSLNWPPG